MRRFLRRKKVSRRIDRLLKKIAANDSELRVVNLNVGNIIGDAGAKRLAEALRVNSTIIMLTLYDNIGAKGARALAETLKVNSTIIYLSLYDNSIGDVGATALAEALEVNSSVRNLALINNGISDEGARVLAEFFQNNSTITYLGLGRNSIGDEGARALAAMLEINSSITVLHLYGNNIGAVGARALARVLPHNSFIIDLVLEDNSIGDAGARELVEMLQVNSSIKSLTLGRNDVSEENLQRVDELIKINADAPTPEDARRLKIMWKIGWLLDSEVGAETTLAVELALDSLGSFPQADQRRGLFEKLLGSTEHGADVAASVDVATARTLYRYAADCGAAPGVVMNLMRAHPSLCTCRDVRHGLFPFMLLATMATAGVGNVLEMLLLNPNLVESGIHIVD